MNLGIFIIICITWLRLRDDILDFQKNNYCLRPYSKWLNFKRIKSVQKYSLKSYAFMPRSKRLITTSSFILLAMLIVFIRLSSIPIFVVAIALCIFSFPYMLIAFTINLPLENQLESSSFKKADTLLRENPSLKIIAIINNTDSYNTNNQTKDNPNIKDNPNTKDNSNTKDILSQMLERDFNVLTTPNNCYEKAEIAKVINSQLRPIHQIFITEIKLSKAHEICDFISPKYTIIPSNSSLENIYDGIIKFLTPNSTVFIPDEYNDLKRKREDLNYIRISTDSNLDAEYFVEGSKLSGSQYSFTLCSSKNRKKIRLHTKTKLLDWHNFYDIVTGTAVAREIGVNLDRLGSLLVNIRSS